MAYRYLVDGYNLLYALPDMPTGNWPEKRQALVALLQKQRPQGNNPITLVFDSRTGLGDRSQDRDLTIIFTAGETADDWIAAQVREASNPRALVIVSNDLGIRASVQGTGAKFITVSEFLKVKPSAPSHRGSSKPTPDPDITDELKKKWL